MLRRMGLISNDLVERMPFSAEPLQLWSEDTDLRHFLLELSSIEGTLLTADGHRETINYVDYGDYLYQQGGRDFRAWAYRFLEEAERSAARAGEMTIPDFYLHHSFGTLAKHAVAYEGIVHTAMSSGAFFSIAHISESLDDLRCSVMLASKLYYKHAQQVLRSFLEDLVLPVYFATNPKAYASWRENDYRTPPLRGRKGILKSLLSEQVLDEELAGEVSEFYDSLNSYVHGSEQRLVNKGYYTRERVGRAFNEDDYTEWCTYVVTAVLFAVPLLQINLAQWEAFSTRHEVVCPICHNDRMFTAEEFVFGGENFTRYECQSCKNVVTHSFNGRQAFFPSFDGEITSCQY